MYPHVVTDCVCVFQYEEAGNIWHPRFVLSLLSAWLTLSTTLCVKSQAVTDLFALQPSSCPAALSALLTENSAGSYWECHPEVSSKLSHKSMWLPLPKGKLKCFWLVEKIKQKFHWRIWGNAAKKKVFSLRQLFFKDLFIFLSSLPCKKTIGSTCLIWL